MVKRKDGPLLLTNGQLNTVLIESIDCQKQTKNGQL